MKLDKLIKEKYGTITNILKHTDVIKRCYLYDIIRGTKTNPTKKVIKEFARLLDISVGEVIDILDEIENDTK